MYIVHRKCRDTSTRTSRSTVLEKDRNHCHPTSPTVRSLFACRKRAKKTERLYIVLVAWILLLRDANVRRMTSIDKIAVQEPIPWGSSICNCLRRILEVQN